MNESIFTKISKKLKFLDPIVAWLKRHPFLTFVVVVLAFDVEQLLSILIHLFK